MSTNSSQILNTILVTKFEVGGGASIAPVSLQGVPLSHEKERCTNVESC